MHLKRITSIFSIIMIFMFTIGQSLMPIIVNAQELNTSGLVDSFQIGKTNLQTTERTKVTVNFSEKNGLRLKPGDTLTLTLPPELKGLDKTFPLDDYGTCKATAGTVVCTFNDKVNTHQSIKGYLNFYVEAANVGMDQKKEIETNFGTNVNKQTVTITGPTSGGGTDPGKPPFFYKTGDMNSGKDDEVRWFLNINLNKEELSRDIVVTDNLQEGQTLNKDSFYIIIDDYLGRRSLSLTEFEQKRYGKITFTGENSFQVLLYRDKARLASFTIGYTSTITEAGKKQDYFKNDYTIDYQVYNKDTVTESGSYQVENMTAGGGASGDLPSKGTLKIVKHLEGNKDKVIPNVSFKLYKESGEQVGDQYTTDEKGIIEIKDLLPGKYYVQEVSAPNYIDFDPQTKVAFEVKADAVNGIELPISNKVKTTSVAGTKTWKDNNAINRPKTIKVDLLQNGTVIATQEASEATGWKYEFKDLTVYNTDGKEYKYEVKEQPVNGYESKVNGYDITNTKVGKTKVEGTKIWKDNDATDRPIKVQVELFRNGEKIDTKEVTAINNWKYTFDNLEAYDANGVAYKYEVKEKPVPGYKSEVNGYDITNTKVGKTKVEGTKTWKDNNTTNRPSTIKVNLLQNGTVIDTKEVTAINNWKYTFDNLEAYDAEGKTYKYEVKEEPIDGYQSEVNGYDITNTKVGQTRVEGIKTWNDNNATDRPSTIKVDLLQNDTVIDTKEVSAATNWKYTFDNLPAYDANGKAYKYEVKEQPVPGYESKVNGYDITNTKVGKVIVEGTKTWKDNNATDRPSTIQVDLYQNGTFLLTQYVTAAGDWKYTFVDLPAYDANGKAYTYTVKEKPVPGYESKVNGYDITNTKVGKTKVEGTKTWKDNNATDRPSSIQVELLRNGESVDTKEVTASTNWKYTFDNLEAYDANGVAYKYEVKEKPVAGYESKVNGYDITNTKVGKTKVEGTKTWKDNNATDRPSSIQVELHRNGEKIDTKEVTAADGWKYTFDNLEAYDANGVAYKYEVKEKPVAGYESKVNGYDITNTKVGKTAVEGTKTWKDDNAKDRPAMIKVDLLQNGKVIATQEVTAEKGWKYAFKDLAAYDANGVAYKYEVKEQPVDGYKSEVKGYDITNTKVGETKVEGTKTWKDDNAKDRPSMIKVDLLQNGKVIAMKEVSEATSWKYAFTDLAAYDVDGKAYKYEVKEQPVDGYQSEVNGYDITNTKIPEWTDEDPKDPNKGPNVDPKDLNTNTDTNSDPKDPNKGSNVDPKVPSNKENDKTTVLLPKTGGAPAEMISIVGGMVLFVIGGILFARQRIKQ
ncbi:Cna B-type domain-containing protein [Bacillus sp. WLY-B-L8]|uniref:Cna B-type domain-containing protein n=1 Tax=Bacillus multifaciens TaxID=3068506 RepID=UPI002741637B|nr:Cna B-type domain-containing protein [Bacillus sp. WLY-B-L8]MDP7978256.1 Cna B-type domain-containing protein [Bacillus sp. WLY-B-L8]